MRRYRALTKKDQIKTLRDFLWKKRMNQTQFLDWLHERGVPLSPGHLSELLSGKKTPGPRFIAVFKEITGVELEPGLVERSKSDGL